MRQGAILGLVATLLGLGPSWGCASAADGAPANTCNASLQSEQGESLQGWSIQGISPQGLSPQGFNPQGFTQQGTSAQGMSVQGLNLQGFNLQGFSAQGLTSQGLSAQGLSVQGFSTQGIYIQGTSLQGVSSAKVGLGGIALRGVSLEEAKRWAASSDTVLEPKQIVRLALDRGVLSARTLNGEALSNDQMVGLLMPFASADAPTAWLQLENIAPHPERADLPLYAFTLDGQSLCAEGKGGLFVPGAWDESGAVFASLGADAHHVDTTFSCLAGVIAKCVVWGYEPWRVGAELHETCTRMARADYCGIGEPHTQNGTMIDMFDTHGIQTEVPNDGLGFEAGWGPDGAVCVKEPRYHELDDSGKQVLPSCWNAKLRCSDWTEAQAQGAEIANNSPHATRFLSAPRGCQ